MTSSYKRCPECGSVQIYRRTRLRGYKCKRCGAVFDKPRTETEERREDRDRETITISHELKSKIESWLGFPEDAGIDIDTFIIHEGYQMLAEKKNELLNVIDSLADIHRKTRDSMKRGIVCFSGCIEVTIASRVYSKKLLGIGDGNLIISLKLEANFTEHYTVSVKFVREDHCRTVYSSHLLKIGDFTRGQSPVEIAEERIEKLLDSKDSRR